MCGVRRGMKHEDFVVLAAVKTKNGFAVKVYFEWGETLTIETSSRTAYDVVFVAKKIQRHIDYYVFGDDFRWHEVSVPRHVMWDRWWAYAESLGEVLSQVPCIGVERRMSAAF
jgi:hypothetical protein